ncbi:ribosome small subunit-dependent GTPase A [Desulfopila sp. IMCC35008]|uniref:ribosome small subunit-dependent GTPase A n=1 Tax=Desulfopila sp. IMCC35008 TaxID=2653858 RepID=UPI001F116132|nr:ribosome small subunit-dependent GTPase A [Desulfopila sp. IMCC35008]
MKIQEKFIQTERQTPQLNNNNIGWSAFFQQQLGSNQSGLTPSRICGVRRNCFLVTQGGDETQVTVAGSLMNDPEALYPAVGDWVLLRDSVITSVLSRKNVLSRKAAGGRGRKDSAGTVQNQVIAANLDTTFIVCGLDRDFNLRRIERYLTLVYNCNIAPTILLTKSDLHPRPESCVEEVESIAFGVPVHLISAMDNDSLSQLEDYLSPGKTVALVGSSGVGKSTLINRLYGREVQATASVSQSLGKGRHTTTNRDLIVLPSGGMVIDNPGIREIAFGVESAPADSVFSDIEKYALSCRFPNCTHTHEPGCEVQRAMAAGELSPVRLRSFQKIKSELDYFADREIRGSARVEKERWKGVSRKIKAIRKRR